VWPKRIFNFMPSTQTLTSDVPILFLCSALFTGGAERQWAILVPRLREHGFEPHVVTLKARGRFFEELHSLGIRTDCLEMRSRWDMIRALRARALVGSLPKLLVTREVNAHVLGAVLARRVGAAQIAVDHAGIGLGRAMHRRFLIRLIASRVASTVAVTETQVDELVSLGYRRDRLRVIPNGVPALEPGDDRTETRRRLGLTPEDFLALLVGGIRQEKRVALFLDAVARAHRQNSRIRGVVAGGGAAITEMRHLAARTGTPVELLGERNDIAELMHAADAICLSSSNEGLPVTLLEASSLGRPIVAFDVGGVREIVGDEDAGLLVRQSGDAVRDAAAFAEAVLQLSGDANLARKLAEGARRRYQAGFTAEHMVDQYVKLFLDVLSGNDAAPAYRTERQRSASVDRQA
jgi:glycosyltransferase involved in cell wall biosynthesis